MAEFAPQSPQVYDGDDIIVKINGKETLHATNHTLTMDMATNERRTKTTRGITRKPGDISWSINADALFVVNDGGAQFMSNFDVLDLLQTKEEVEVTLIATAPGSTEAVTYTGKAWFTNISVNAQSGEDANYSATLTGSGDLTKVAG